MRKGVVLLIVVGTGHHGREVQAAGTKESHLLTVRKQRAMNLNTMPSFPHRITSLFLSCTSSHPSLAHREVCILGDYRSHQVENQY